jgi:(5-formylfuran-3-yl)methyl phosphate synthase
MTGMLASVNSLAEARLVLAKNVDIIDLKDPVSGSLGGLDINLVKSIVAVVNGRCPTSATIGDLPMQADLVFNAVKEMAETGVNYVKVGFFVSENQVQVIEKLATIAAQTKLIAVLFADTNPDFSLIAKLKAAGFRGIMLDTQDKTKVPLTGMMAKTEIERFVTEVKSGDIVCGLAGALRLEDIPVLLPYQPHYLGFRGALCERHERGGRLNVRSVQSIKQAIAGFCC